MNFPFNFNPSSVDVKTNTTNEAIPTDKFARVTVFCKASTDEFYINDEIALTGETNTLFRGNNLFVATNGAQNELVVKNLAGGETGGGAGETSANFPVVHDFWVPSGTNLKVTNNARYTLQLYDLTET